MATPTIPTTHPALRRWRRWSYGPHGRLSDYWRRVLTADPGSADLLQTVELVFGDDQVVRCATREVRVTSDFTGDTVDYLPLLMQEAEVDHTYTLGQASSSARSLSLSVPNAMVDAAAVIARGRMLAGYGEVALQVGGGDHDERLVLLRGDMDDGVTFGDLGAGLVECSITDPKESADLNLPPWVVDSDRWNDHDGSASGMRYPVVLNRYNDVPALFVDDGTTSGDPRWLAVEGHGWDVDDVKVDGTSYAASSTEYQWQVEETIDGLGVPVTLIEFTGGSSLPFDGSESVHVTVSGGLRARTLVEAIEYLARDYTVLGNAGLAGDLFSTASARLGVVPARVLVNASGGDSAARCLEYVEGELLASFPMVSMVWDVGGYGPVVTDRRDSRIVAALEPGVYPLIDRESDVQEWPKAKLFNSFTLRYAYNLLEDTYEAVATRTPDNSILCQISRDQAGERHADPIESRVIYDEATAEYVVDWLVEHMALPSYYVEYTALPWVLFFLRRGDNVTLTDGDFSWVDQVATVERITYRRGSCTLGLRVWARYYDLGGGASTATPAGGGGGQ